MYENVTEEVILKRLLSHDAADGLDTRESSPYYNGVAPSAAELAKVYLALDIFFQESFAGSASRRFLIFRCAERGITPFPATPAIVKGEFSPAGVDVLYKRFTNNGIIYMAAEEISTGSYRMECETPGEAGNLSDGVLVPLSDSYVEGLETARITALITPGEEEETTEHLRQRYYDSLDPSAFGGNRADYKSKVTSISGVGGVKIYRAKYGGGTVGLTIITSSFGVPSAEQIDDIQTQIDPEVNQGDGLGTAPIGHVVTVSGVTAVPLDISFRISYAGTWTWTDLQYAAETVIDGYFLELGTTWADSDHLIVRISQLESRLLELEGVLDIGDTVINGAAQNFVLGADDIPVRGAVSG